MVSFFIFLVLGLELIVREKSSLRFLRVKNESLISLAKKFPCSSNRFFLEKFVRSFCERERVIGSFYSFVLGTQTTPLFAVANVGLSRIFLEFLNKPRL